MSEREFYFEDVEMGDDIGPVERTITGEQVRAFVGLWGGDSGANRFTSDEAAIEEGLPGAIVPGAMNVGIVAHAITGWAPNLTLKTLDLVFRQMVRHNVRTRSRASSPTRPTASGRSSATCGWRAGWHPARHRKGDRRPADPELASYPGSPSAPSPCAVEVDRLPLDP